MRSYTIKSQSHSYDVFQFLNLEAALAAVDACDRVTWLIDEVFFGIYRDKLGTYLSSGRVVLVRATEEQKSFEVLAPIFLELLKCGLKRDGRLVVVGGGVLQDIGCFIATVLFRGVKWDLIPTTLLAQADSCIGSKSSINIGSFKNQIGTFYPPHRILMTTEVLTSLPWDEIRSGMGEVIKLQLLAGEEPFRELIADLGEASERPNNMLLSKWVARSIAVKQPYIERDEYDKGERNLLNYGHTFGHAYESASNYQIPHGIAVVLGVLTATRLSANLGMVSKSHLNALLSLLGPWHEPYGKVLKSLDRVALLNAIKLDKKNTGNVINCILTEGFGRMRKHPVILLDQILPAISNFIDNDLAAV